MEIIAYVLWLSGQVLFQAIICFLLAVPTGMGLAIGFQWIKKWFTPKKEEPISFEEMAAGIVV
jgi:cytochrome b subunit of formate dehydrogenase